MANEALHWIVQCAEEQGLALDDDFLAPYTPCFNSELHNSMGLKSRLLGRIVRPIGTSDPKSEGLHQATIDRQAMAELGYAPSNVANYMVTGIALTYNTTRVDRGNPC